VAGLFRFRRRDESSGAQPPEPQDSPGSLGSDGTAVADSGQASPDGPVHWVAEASSSASGSTSGPGHGPGGSAVGLTPGDVLPGSAAHERSDPSRAATEGLWEVIRPAAIVPEHAARRVLVELARRDLTNGGEWQSEPQLWSRFEGPLTGDGSQPPELMGTIHVTYGTPTKYEITLYRVTVTAAGVHEGWTVASLTDEALGFGGLTLAQCPRAMVNEPPRPYRY
jgi:hypothetical protein